MITNESENSFWLKYYELQYRRVEVLEDLGFKMSAGVFLLTSAVLAFGNRGSATAAAPMRSLALGVLIANVIAIFYTHL